MLKRPTDQEIAEWNEAYRTREENYPKRLDFPDDLSFHWAVRKFWDAQPPDYLYSSDESDGGMLPSPEESVGSPSPPPPVLSPPVVSSRPKPKRARISWRLKPRDGVASRTRGGITKKKRMPWIFEDDLKFYELDAKGLSQLVCDPSCPDEVVSSLIFFLSLLLSFSRLSYPLFQFPISWF